MKVYIVKKVFEYIDTEKVKNVYSSYAKAERYIKENGNKAGNTYYDESGLAYYVIEDMEIL